MKGMSCGSFGAACRQGLWSENPALIQVLGLCPLLAVSGTAVNGLALGAATTAVLVLSGATVSLIRRAIPAEVRIPTFVIVIATFVTAIDMLMAAYFHDVHRILGLFVPLIVTNCAILGRAEAFASRNPAPLATWDGLMMGLGFSGVLVVMGMIREILGSGTLFEGAGSLLGPAWSWLETTVIPGYGDFLLVILPPGAFLVLGFLMALRNLVDTRVQARREAGPRRAARSAPEIRPRAT